MCGFHQSQTRGFKNQCRSVDQELHRFYQQQTVSIARRNLGSKSTAGQHALVGRFVYERASPCPNGKIHRGREYFDDAVKQVNQFSSRMFNKEKGIYMDGWVQSMEHHPEFHWARANGWAVMTLVELLEVLPKNHPGYAGVLAQLQAHIKGLAKYQDGTGFWHQLLDRNDSYLETSATAIYTYSIARAINRGYVDKMTYSPMVLLAWNAVASKVNDKGQVEGTCVGTGMGFDPAFSLPSPHKCICGSRVWACFIGWSRSDFVVERQPIRNQ